MQGFVRRCVGPNLPLATATTVAGDKVAAIIAPPAAFQFLKRSSALDLTLRKDSAFILSPRRMRPVRIINGNPVHFVHAALDGISDQIRTAGNSHHLQLATSF